MSSAEQYPAMDHFFATYFGQDYDLFGETVPEIVSCYKKDSPYDYENLRREIDRFRENHSNDLGAAFDRKYGAGFSPEPWGYTISSFFDELKRLLD